MSYPIIENFNVAAGAAGATGIAYDGVANGNGSIFVALNTDCAIVEMRARDGAYLKADGTTGTLADATFPVAASYGPCSIMADSTYVWVTTENSTIRRFRRSDRVNDITIDVTGYAVNGPTDRGTTCQGNLYFGLNAPSVGTSAIIKINPSTGAYTIVNGTLPVCDHVRLTSNGVVVFSSCGNGIGYDNGRIRSFNPNTLAPIELYAPGGAVPAYGLNFLTGDLFAMTYVSSGYPYIVSGSWSAKASIRSSAPGTQLGASLGYCVYDGEYTWFAPLTTAGITGKWKGAYPGTPPLHYTQYWNGYTNSNFGFVAGGMCFDGNYVWTTRNASNPSSVYRIRTNSVLPPEHPDCEASQQPVAPTPVTPPVRVWT